MAKRLTAKNQAERLERATWDLFWVPAETRIVARPDVLAIALSGRSASLNSVFRAEGATSALPGLIEEVRGLHDGGPSRWQLTDRGTSVALERALAEAGYAETHTHDARIVAVREFAARRAGFAVRVVSNAETLRHANIVRDEAFDRRPEASDEDADLALFTDPSERSRLFVVYDQNEPVCAGGINLYPGLGIGLLWGGGTTPSARGRGAYSTLLAHRIAFAESRRITDVGIYARVGSSSPIVEALGFKRCGAMTYWEQMLT